MKSFNFILIISVCVLLCTGRDNCNNSVLITGKYQNIYDKEAKNMLVINSDGTFEQIFEKKSIITRNKGTWKFFPESCAVHFEELKIMHSLPKSYVIDFSKMPGLFRNNNIIFVEGMAFEYDFFRIKE